MIGEAFNLRFILGMQKEKLAAEVVAYSIPELETLRAKALRIIDCSGQRGEILYYRFVLTIIDMELNKRGEAHAKSL